MTTAWQLVSLVIEDRHYRDVVSVLARLDCGQLFYRQPMVLLDRRRGARDYHGDLDYPVPFTQRLTDRELEYIEECVVRMHERKPLPETCVVCSRSFERCACEQDAAELSVA